MTNTAPARHRRCAKYVEQYPYVDVQLFSSLKKQGLEALGSRLDTFFGYVD
jgi:GTP-binding protein